MRMPRQSPRIEFWAVEPLRPPRTPRQPTTARWFVRSQRTVRLVSAPAGRPILSRVPHRQASGHLSLLLCGLVSSWRRDGDGTAGRRRWCALAPARSRWWRCVGRRRPLMVRASFQAILSAFSLRRHYCQLKAQSKRYHTTRPAPSGPPSRRPPPRLPQGFLCLPALIRLQSKPN